MLVCYILLTLKKICHKYNFPLVGMVVDLYVTCACIMFKVSLSVGRERDDSRSLYGGRLRVKRSRTVTGVVPSCCRESFGCMYIKRVQVAPPFCPRFKTGALCIDFPLVGYVTVEKTVTITTFRWSAWWWICMLRV